MSCAIAYSGAGDGNNDNQLPLKSPNALLLPGLRWLQGKVLHQPVFASGQYRDVESRLAEDRIQIDFLLVNAGQQFHVRHCVALIRYQYQGHFLSGLSARLEPIENNALELPQLLNERFGIGYMRS